MSKDTSVDAVMKGVKEICNGLSPLIYNFLAHPRTQRRIQCWTDESNTNRSDILNAVTKTGVELYLNERRSKQ